MSEIIRRGIMFVLSAPSGAGKSSLIQALIKEDITPSISATTRPKREYEQEGKEYFFMDENKFNQFIEAGKFLEYASIYNNLYGTLKEVALDFIEKGKDQIFALNFQGKKTLRQHLPKDVVSIYILPPSLTELNSRLLKRNSENLSQVELRMKRAKSEIEHYIEYDYVVINDDFDIALNSIKAIIKAERLKKHRQINLKAFVDNIMGS